MSKLSKYSRSGISALQLTPKSLILLLVLCLLVFAATALAQEGYARKTCKRDGYLRVRQQN